MSTIQFAHAEDGKLKFDLVTSEASLMQLGALAHTAIRSQSTVEFATDFAGLSEAYNTAESASYSIANHIQSVGQLLAYVDQKGIDADIVQDIGWMLASFGRHLMDLNTLQQGLTEAMNKAKTVKKGARA